MTPHPDWIKHLPPGTIVELIDEETIGEARTLSASGTATGPSASARGDDLDDAVTGAAGTLDLRAGQASTGTADRQTSGRAWGTADGIGMWLVIVAGVFALGGVLSWWWGSRRLAVGLGIVAAALIASAQWPLLAPLILIGGLAAVTVPLLLADGRGKRLAKTIRGFATGFEEARVKDPEAVKRLEPHLSAKMENDDKAVIREIKATLSK